MGGRGIDRSSATDAAFETVVGEICAVLRRAGLDRTLAIGSLILDRFFEGSVEAWRARRNNKNNSVRRLAQRPDCPLSRSSLNRAIGICAVTKAVPSVLKLVHIEAGHIGIVLPLEAHEQEAWLVKANAHRWSVRQLRDAILRERRLRGERRGRPRASRWQQALSASRGSLARLEALIASLGGLEPDYESDRVLVELNERLVALQGQLAEVPGATRGNRRDSGPWAVALPANSGGDEDPDEVLAS
jgi:hypothetical protein